MTAPEPPRPEALSPAERLKARVQQGSGGTLGMTVFDDKRPWWVKAIEDITKQGEDSAEGLTHTLAETLVNADERGQRCPPELYELARAYLQPRHYRADRDRARTHDPETSQKTANDEKRPRRARTQAHELLKAYGKVADHDAAMTAPERLAHGIRSPYYGGLTAPEAALMIGKPGAWRRTPELHQDGLIETIRMSEYAGPQPGTEDWTDGQLDVSPATRETVYGAQARVFRITELGRDELRRMNAEERAYDRQKAAREGARGKRA